MWRLLILLGSINSAHSSVSEKEESDEKGSYKRRIDLTRLVELS